MTLVESACDLNPPSSNPLPEQIFPDISTLESHTKTRLKAALGLRLYTAFFDSLKLVAITDGCALWSLPVKPIEGIHDRYKGRLIDCMGEHSITEARLTCRGIVRMTRLPRLTSPPTAQPRALLRRPPLAKLTFHPPVEAIPPPLESPENQENLPAVDEGQNPPRRIFIEDIQHVVALHYGLTKAKLCSNKRTRAIVRPRQIAIYLSKILTPQTFPQIGYRFGGRDHTTVLHAVRKIEWLIHTSESMARDIALLETLIHERIASTRPFNVRDTTCML